MIYVPKIPQGGGGFRLMAHGLLGRAEQCGGNLTCKETLRTEG